MRNILHKFRRRIEEDIIFRNIVLAISVVLIVIILLYISLGMFTRHGQRNVVPDFNGMTIEEAMMESEKLGLQFEITDSLFVASKPKEAILEQYPKPGNFVKRGRRIFVTTNSFTPKTVPMPYVSGFSLRQAKNKIIGSGFVIDKIIYREDLATYNVLQQLYKGKEITTHQNIMGEIGSGVTLVVGLNPVDPEPIIPNLIGLTTNEAKNRLWEAGFNIGNIEYDNDIDDDNRAQAKIYNQNPHITADFLFLSYMK
ncbi:MAG: PASTA domain-containing protein, partial [Rikenellaceae bacterium]